jgi:isopenicillin N synthase-like dioxygenase
LYFFLPLEVKQQWKRNAGNARGWFNDELTKQKLDWKEALDLGVPGTRDWTTRDDDAENKCLDGWNQLPSEDILPNFRSTVTKYFDECSKLADTVAILMAKGLGQEETSPMIQELREKHSSYLRSNYYPLCNVLAEDGTKPLGISPHRDAGFLTVLLQDADCHSLQVMKDDTTWVTIHPEPYALTINTGDMAEVWSNGRYKAPLHRVLSNETKERFSTPYFYNPSYETIVEPLVGDNEEAMYFGVLWGYFRAVRFAGDLSGTWYDRRYKQLLLQKVVEFSNFENSIRPLLFFSFLLLIVYHTKDIGVEIQVADFLKDEPSLHVEKQNVFRKVADFGIPFNVETFRPLLVEGSTNTDLPEQSQ